MDEDADRISNALERDARDGKGLGCPCAERRHAAKGLEPQIAEYMRSLGRSTLENESCRVPIARVRELRKLRHVLDVTGQQRALQCSHGVGLQPRPDRATVASASAKLLILGVLEGDRLGHLCLYERGVSCVPPTKSCLHFAVRIIVTPCVSAGLRGAVIACFRWRYLPARSGYPGVIEINAADVRVVGRPLCLVRVPKELSDCLPAREIVGEVCACSAVSGTKTTEPSFLVALCAVRCADHQLIPRALLAMKGLHLASRRPFLMPYKRYRFTGRFKWVKLATHDESLQNAVPMLAAQERDDFDVAEIDEVAVGSGGPPQHASKRRRVASEGNPDSSARVDVHGTVTGLLPNQIIELDGTLLVFCDPGVRIWGTDCDVLTTQSLRTGVRVSLLAFHAASLGERPHALFASALSSVLIHASAPAVECRMCPSPSGMQNWSRCSQPGAPRSFSSWTDEWRTLYQVLTPAGVLLARELCGSLSDMFAAWFIDVQSSGESVVRKVMLTRLLGRPEKRKRSGCKIGTPRGWLADLLLLVQEWHRIQTFAAATSSRSRSNAYEAFARAFCDPLPFDSYFQPECPLIWSVKQLVSQCVLSENPTQESGHSHDPSTALPSRTRIVHSESLKVERRRVLLLGQLQIHEQNGTLRFCDASGGIEVVLFGNSCRGRAMCPVVHGKLSSNLYCLSSFCVVVISPGRRDKTRCALVVDAAHFRMWAEAPQNSLSSYAATLSEQGNGLVGDSPDLMASSLQTRTPPRPNVRFNQASALIVVRCISPVRAQSFRVWGTVVAWRAQSERLWESFQAVESDLRSIDDIESLERRGAVELICTTIEFQTGAPHHV
ncbi:hypothetical protein FVE85_1253 [Porphyridium purpureum]|uniref:Uncharacterized protein n=1 Tax=Porphyridium purpureum TaxID=35688 RepID=A0A5J4YH19_PORPP|nr:hypothetical protein FVE85_1253 [Porphyridium purpureum]|eukprot:POR6609..scf251_18